MTFDQLNECIKHYLENDKTNSAIMLTAPWGTGKSYYIKEILMPFLNVGNKRNCIAISLYGLNSIDEISKSIYIELRLKDFLPQKEVSVIGSAIGKTILKQIINCIGINVDLEIKEDTKKSIYNSIDLTGKLIVFEDVERSGIDIIDFLGYVNNLVEQDGVKVLLVANEDEITNNELKETEIDISEVISSSVNQKSSKNDTASKKNEYKLSDKTKKYLQVKEKTISDTIIFSNDYEAAICNIINRFNNTRLSMFANSAAANEILNLFVQQSNYNLRSFTFACQKTVDLYSNINGDYEADFMKSIFYGNILFSLKMKAGKIIKWDGNRYLSIKLGNSNYPLYYFCYQYIYDHILVLNDIKKCSDEYKELRLYDAEKSRNDKDLGVLESWYIQSENVLREAIISIENRLKDVGNIALQQYGRLAYYFVLISEIIDVDISEGKRLLIDNLKGKGDKIKDHMLFGFPVELETTSKKSEYNELLEQMKKSLNNQNNFFNQFDYDPQNFELFYDYCKNNEQIFLERGTYVSMLNINKFVDMIKGCTARQIYDIKSLFEVMYSTSYNFAEKDKCNISILLEKIRNFGYSSNFDKIQCKQIEFFVNTLENILSRMD